MQRQSRAEHSLLGFCEPVKKKTVGAEGDGGSHRLCRENFCSIAARSAVSKKRDEKNAQMNNPSFSISIAIGSTCEMTLICICFDGSVIATSGAGAPG